MVLANSAALPLWLEGIFTHIETGDSHSTVLKVLSCAMIVVKCFCEGVSGKYWLNAWLFIVNKPSEIVKASVRDLIIFILPLL